jgi:hypothetical protein
MSDGIRTASSRRQPGGRVAALCLPVADQITGMANAVNGAWTAQ